MEKKTLTKKRGEFNSDENNGDDDNDSDDGNDRNDNKSE